MSGSPSLFVSRVNLRRELQDFIPSARRAIGIETGLFEQVPADVVDRGAGVERNAVKLAIPVVRKHVARGGDEIVLREGGILFDERFEGQDEPFVDEGRVACLFEVHDVRGVLLAQATTAFS